MKDPIIIRQRLTNIDWEIDQLTTERITLEAELARVGLKAVEYPSSDPKKATLEEILQGNWHFKNPTPEARKVFEEMGVPLEGETDYWAYGSNNYAEWFNGRAYTTDCIETRNEQRELILDNGKLYFA